MPLNFTLNKMEMLQLQQRLIMKAEKTKSLLNQNTIAQSSSNLEKPTEKQRSLISISQETELTVQRVQTHQL